MPRFRAGMELIPWLNGGAGVTALVGNTTHLRSIEDTRV